MDVLVHGDYQERNILYSKDDVAVVDFEEAHAGDPVEDIGKLTASYLLRIIYFEKIRKDALEATQLLLESYFSHLDIDEDVEALKERLRVYIAGCMLLRVDGISNKWLPWVHVEEKKEITRRFAVELLKSTDDLLTTIKNVSKI